MQTRKAQLKIQEMSFMLLGLVLFFVIAGMFFLLLSTAGLQQSVIDIEKQKTLTTLSRLADSPELNYGESLVVDMDKAIILKDDPLFANYWEIEGLVLRKIYPITNDEIECHTGNYANCNKITLKEPPSAGTELSSFVSLCSKKEQEGFVYDDCELGVISAYVKKTGNETT